ncbi:HAD-IA family hydrolase [Shewanella electrodiphila]|uniref:HAD-IA family hydrolase n=1 Tax=Shewanella electrodiphila TaxID=934143 RepID=A0ABT0KT78_9GAMM|nr:HAD-IA family hydrolase [Shewanella electrodiphila]MCL1046751.1 HAD-IA family hydrolase [Shewanella electrodiphila]
MKHDIDLIIFDCDGVVIDSEIISAQVLINELIPFGIKIDIDYVQRHFLGCNFKSVKQKLNLNFDLQLPDYFESQYRQKLVKKFATSLMTTSGFTEFVNQLEIPYCIATSSSKTRTNKALEIVGLTHLFNSTNIFTAEAVSNGKPAPDLFLHAAKSMKVNPENCLVIEDSFFGVSAAISAKMQIVHYIGGQHLTESFTIVSQTFPDIPVLDNWSNIDSVNLNLIKN